MRCAQVPPRRGRGLPYLRLDIDTLRRIDPPTDCEDVAVRKRGTCGVPPTIVHIRQPRPGIVERVIRVGVRQSHVVGYVSTLYKQTAIGQKGMA